MTVEPAQHDEEQLARMSFGEHLDELRRRLFIGLGALAIAVLGLMPFKESVTEVYIRPYRVMWEDAFNDHREKMEGIAAEAARTGEELDPLYVTAIEFLRERGDQIVDGTFPPEALRYIELQGLFVMPRNLKATGGLEDFWIFMAATLLFGIMLAAPVLLYQLWAFVSAGLYEKERKVVLRYFPFACCLLAAGIAFGYFLAVPYGLYFLSQMMDWSQVEPMFTVGLYFSFLFTLTTALGVVFQLPMLMLALVKVGLLQHETLKKNWRIIVLGFFFFSAVLTPPDPFTQCLMAGPMILLYLMGLFLTSRVAKERGAQPAA